VYRHIVTESRLGLCVNLHLDRDDPRVGVRSQRDDQATVTVSPSTPRNTFIRVPGWAPADPVRLTVAGKPIAPTRVGPYALVPRESIGHRSEIVLHYALPERITEELMRSGRVYRFQWKGDRIVGASPGDGAWPFFPALPDG